MRHIDLKEYRLNNGDRSLKKRRNILLFILCFIAIGSLIYCFKPMSLIKDSLIQSSKRNIQKNAEDNIYQKADYYLAKFKNMIYSYDSNEIITPYISTGSKNNIPPTSGYISQEYGYVKNKTTGNTNRHKGIDLTGDDTVLAVNDGTVTYVGKNNSYGNFVEIEHGGFYAFYSHLSDIFVKVDDKIKQGQNIAVVSNDTSVDSSSCNNKVPHLHFEIRYSEGSTYDVYPNPFIYN